MAKKKMKKAFPKYENYQILKTPIPFEYCPTCFFWNWTIFIYNFWVISFVNAEKGKKKLKSVSKRWKFATL